jgi:outer membrane protein OmpA-like peptidoglycan-associated protein
MKIAARVTRVLAVSVVAGALAAGCATNKDVDRKIAEATANTKAETNQKIESVAAQVETVQQHQKEQDAQIATLSQEAKDALKRAEDAGILAKGAGKVVFQQTFSDDKVKFKSGKYELSKDAKAALDDLGNKLKGMTEHQYFVEIQGHTDDTGGTRYNDELGQRRADEVRRYLSRSASLPLNRMSTISYGDTLPVASNKTRKGRAENRRVVLVVLE